MTDSLLGLGLSLGIHAVGVLSVLTLGAGLGTRGQTIPLDFSLSRAPAGAARAPASRAPRPSPAAARPAPRPALRSVVPSADPAPSPAPAAADAAAQGPFVAVADEPAPGAPGTDAAPQGGAAGYERENFSYVRDRIHRRLVYPLMARKMGWAGQVLVSFVIDEEGAVAEAKVVRSSGYELLDRSALESVRLGAPYPRPPSRAEFVMPVAYRLD